VITFRIVPDSLNGVIHEGLTPAGMDSLKTFQVIRHEVYRAPVITLHQPANFTSGTITFALPPEHHWWFYVVTGVVILLALLAVIEICDWWQWRKTEKLVPAAHPERGHDKQEDDNEGQDRPHMVAMGAHGTNDSADEGELQ
jgi:hypothetical protein